MHLRAHAPGEWENLLNAMRQYSAQTNAEMLRAEPSLLLRAQGMAIALSEITTVLVTAPQLAERTRNAIHGNRPNPAQFK